MERVQLEELTLTNFRNITASKLLPGRRFNVLAGRNGMGKTNLIESIYLLGALRSFRTSVRRELLKHGEDTARVDGVFGGAAAGMRCEIVLETSARRIRVDGKQRRPDGAHFRSLPMVLFHPGNMELAQGGPEARRRFLDRALYQAEPAYPELHRAYNRALASRNRLLKDRSPDRRAIRPFDVQLSERGARIGEIRARFVADLAPLVVEAFSELSGGSAAHAVYRPSVSGGSDQLAEALESSIDVDEKRGYTSLGPHADDLLLTVNARVARRFASQGQQRAMVLSLKIAETRALATITERVPLLLLDDVSSELDAECNERLFAFLRGIGGQVFITTTHIESIRIESERNDFSVVDGSVVSAA
jgi:DNA replication and repair protein RecF